MPHHTPLITTIVVGPGLAFLLGALANRLRFSPLVGCLVAGVLIGPFPPGCVADQGLALQLAEIGVILLTSAPAKSSPSRLGGINNGDLH
jgi:CPA2 family monovalent cation:H+ antiporter-2